MNNCPFWDQWTTNDFTLMGKNYITKRIISDSPSLYKTTSKESLTWKPKECATQENKSECPFCHTAVLGEYVICPTCGRSLTPDKCSFCGAAKRPTAKFCTHCGQSSQGVICPRCGTLNSRNFCRNCNHPLTPMAQKAVAEANNDPKFKILQVKSEELAGLHARIEELRNAADEKEYEIPELSAADQTMLDEYAYILASIGVAKPEIKSESNKTGTPKQESRPKYEDKAAMLDEALKTYKEKAAEMDAALSALTPPPDFTPEQQRDYYSARKVATVVKNYDMSSYDPMMWQCNLCGALHKAPTQCAAPELGGVWIYITPEQYNSQMEGYNVTSTTLKIK